MSEASKLLSTLVSLGGAGIEITEIAGGPAPQSGPGVVRVGVHRAGPLPNIDPEPFDILLSRDEQAPRPWVGLVSIDEALDLLGTTIQRQPVAAAVVAQVLRMGLVLSFDQALLLESLAYSMLLASEGFRAWRATHPARIHSENTGPRVLSEQDDDGLHIRLNRAEARNAFDAAMRDELMAALEFAQSRADFSRIELSGLGPAFSAGGDLNEFGCAEDVGCAHLIRTMQSPVRAVRKLGARMRVRLHGACIGAGIEIPAAAAHVCAIANTFFRLPEIGMGLIPGAGGTASIPRRIGRHRTCYMALSRADIDRDTALAWGLIDEALP